MVLASVIDLSLSASSAGASSRPHSLCWGTPGPSPPAPPPWVIASILTSCQSNLHSDDSRVPTPSLTHVTGVCACDRPPTKVLVAVTPDHPSEVPSSPQRDPVLPASSPRAGHSPCCPTLAIGTACRLRLQNSQIQTLLCFPIMAHPAASSWPCSPQPVLRAPRRGLVTPLLLSPLQGLPPPPTESKPEALPQPKSSSEPAPTALDPTYAALSR